MNKIWVIARREFMAMVGTRAFLATLLIMPLMMFGGLVLMPTLNKLSGGRERVIRIVDGTGRIGPALAAMAEQRNKLLTESQVQADSNDAKKSARAMAGDMGLDPYRIELQQERNLDDSTRLQWSDMVRDGSLYAFVEIPESLFDPASADTVRFVSQDAVLSEARQWMQGITDAIVREDRFKVLGLDSEKVQLANRPVSFAPTSPYERSATSEGGEASIEAKEEGFDLAKFFAPFGMMMLMFMVIFLAAQPMLESAMEEKSQRISEVLLGSVSPTQLLAGKLIGNVAASLLVFALYAIGAYAFLVQRGMHHLVPMSLVPWFLVFQVLGVLFFSSIFMMIGASVRDLKEAQSLLLPVWLFMMLPMMVWFIAVRDPLGPVALALSMLPPSAPMMNVLRMGTGVTIPLWQPIAAAILLAVATAMVIWVAGRIYKLSMLRSDSVKTIGQLMTRIASVLTQGTSK
jgi:ABC-2 type transport system permease protein